MAIFCSNTSFLHPTYSRENFSLITFIIERKVSLALISCIPFSSQPITSNVKPEVCEQLNNVAGLPIWDFTEKPSVVLEWSRESSQVIMTSVFAPYFSFADFDRLAFGESMPSDSK